MAKVADVEIVLRAQNATLQADLDKAKSQISRFARESSTGFSKLGASIKGAFGLNLGHLATVAGLGLLTRELVHATEAAFSFAKATVESARNFGISTDALQELRFAASQTGVSMESLDNALKFVNKNTSLAIGGNTKLGDAFDRLGLSIRDLRSKSTDEIFGIVLDQLGKIPTAAERTRLSMQLLGRGGSELGKLATIGAEGIHDLRQESHELGLVIDGETLESAKRAGEKFEALFAVLKTQGIATLLTFSEEMTAIAQALLEAAKNAQIFFDKFRSPETQKTIEGMTKTIDALQKLIATPPRGTTFEDISRRKKELDDLLAKRAELSVGAASPGDIGPERDLGTGRNTAALAKAARDAATARSKLAAAERSAESKFAETIRRDLQEQEDSEKIILATKEQRLQAEAELAAALGNTTEAEAKQKELIEARFATERQMIEAHVIDAEQRKQAIEDLNAAEGATLAKAAKEANSEFKHLKDFGLSGISDALADLALTGKLTFASLGQSFLREFIQVAINKGLNKLVDELASISAASATGGNAGWIASALSLFTMADGGIVTRPTLAMVGEAGPEAVIPLSRLGSSGGGDVTVNVIEAPGTKATVSSQRTPSGGTRLDITIVKLIADDFARSGPVSQSAAKTFGLSRRGERVG